MAAWIEPAKQPHGYSVSGIPIRLEIVPAPDIAIIGVPAFVGGFEIAAAGARGY
jgi:hypothetical protein